MRDSGIYYRSFYEAGLALSEEQRGKYYTIIFRYMFDFEKEESDDPIVNAMFKLVAPQIEANIRKYENGKKPKGKQEGSKDEAKDKQDGSETEGNVNDNVNDNDNVNGDENVYRAFAHLSITIDEVDKLKEKGFTQDQIDSVLDNVQNFKKNKKYTSLYLTAMNRLKRDHPPEKEPKTEYEFIALLKKIGTPAFTKLYGESKHTEIKLASL